MKTITDLWIEEAKEKFSDKSPTFISDTFYFNSENSFKYDFHVEDNNIQIFCNSENNEDYGYIFKIKNNQIVWIDETKALLPNDLIVYIENWIKNNVSS